MRLVHDMLREWFADLGLAGPQRLAIEFMRAHAGAVIVLPEAAAVERMAESQQTVRSLDAAGASDVAVDRLARIHGKPKRRVAKAYMQAGGRGVLEVRRLARAEREAAAKAGPTGALPCKSARLSRFRLVARA